MKLIGILGGMSWESTITYYRLLNEEVRARLGGLHSARLLMHSVDFADIRVLQQEARWEEAGQVLGAIGRQLAGAGADFLLIATNTMHKVADAVEAAAGIPVLHIVDPTARAIQKRGMHRIALLGTGYTMREEFYKGRMRERFGLEVLVPSEADMRVVDKIIFEELCVGKIQDSARAEYLRIIAALQKQGAEGVILGCTEIGLLVQQEHTDLALFDTTRLHAEAAVTQSLE